MAHCRKILRFVLGECGCNRTIVNSFRTPTVSVSYLGDGRVISATDHEGDEVAHENTYTTSLFNSLSRVARIISSAADVAPYPGMLVTEPSRRKKTSTTRSTRQPSQAERAER